MLTPPRDLSNPDNIADSVLYWRTRRATANSSAIPAAGGATALALLAATTIPTLAGGRPDTSHSVARGAGRIGVDAKTRTHLVARVPQRTAFSSRAITGLGAPAAAASSQTRAAVTYGTITQVQKLLGVTADGKLGALTAAAIRDFQAKHGLPVNGVVDETTFNAMQAAYTPPAQAVAPNAPTVGGSSGGGVFALAAWAAPTTVAATAPVVATTQTPASTGGTTATDATTAIDAAITTTDSGGSAPTATDATATTADATSATTTPAADTTDTAVGTQPSVPSGVSAVQTALDLPADGTFGAQTKAAVETFQADHGLTPDGVVGPATRAALGIGDGPTLEDTQPPPPPPAPTTTATTDGSITTGDGAATSPTSDSTTSSSDTSTSTTSTSTSSDGTPANIATGINEMIQAGWQIAKLPYIWGGGHGSWVAPGYDCSGSVSYVLHAAGLLSVPEDSGTLMSYGAPGPGKYVTIYASPGHAWMTIDGERFDTVALSEDGSRWASGGGEFAGFVERHPIGY
jgi:peptidoglycan hydrolase-like protein with peptidoglycan-binding domain